MAKVTKINPGAVLLLGLPDGVGAGLTPDGKLQLKVDGEGVSLVAEFENADEAQGLGVALIGGAAIVALRQQALRMAKAGKLVRQ